MDVDEPEDHETERDEPTGGYFSDIWKSFKTETRRFKFYLEVLAVLGAAVYTTYTIKMYSANRHAADAARSAATTAKQTLILSNRSWIEITKDQSMFKDGIPVKKFRDDLKSVSFPMRITNVGKFPVQDVDIVAAGEVLNSDQATNFSYGGSAGLATTYVTGIIYPTRYAVINVGQFAKGSTPDNPDNKFEPVSEDMRNDIAKGRKYFVWYARGTFSDDFGKHWFQYCEWIAPADVSGVVAARNCTEYNKVGDF